MSSSIRSGPTPQFMPITSISSIGSSATSAGRDVRPREHLLVRVDDRELHHQRQAHAGPLHLLDGGDRDALRLQDVEARLDEDRVDAAPRS